MIRSSVRILKPCAPPADRARNRLYGLVLSDHSLMEQFVQLEQLFALGACKLLDWYLRPDRNNLFDVFLCNGRRFSAVSCIDALFLAFQLLFQLLFRPLYSFASEMRLPLTPAPALSTPHHTAAADRLSLLPYGNTRAACAKLPQSIRSIALSGRNRSLMYRLESFTAASSASSVISTP